MSQDWSPGEGEQVYVEVEHKSGRIIACEPEGDDVVYVVELDADPGALEGNQTHRWGYEQPESLRCTIEELAPA